jgi:hypothetical protein
MRLTSGAMMAKSRLRRLAKNTLSPLGLAPLARKIRKKFSAVQWVRTLNKTRIFHTTSPNLLVALVLAFRHLEKHHPELLKNASYLEFGLYKGFSLWFAESISREITGNFTLFGFDSFSGLPKTAIDKAEPYWSPGAYACSQEEVIANIRDSGGDLSRIRLVGGWFSKELFAGVKPDIAARKPALVVIDSDVYESCRIILEEFGPLFRRGTVILFDDFNAFEKSDDHGERRALREFQASHGNFKIAPLFDFGWHGEAFVVKHEA